ncbi:excalibur calcium-binding domain-containing protein [Pseudarthrobacter sp. RMG13]|uniref:Excalibur calcium-binding domain-containing protein n=1 Tax=Pseudarthrobacter humi TaxID=2952523 RepID=A0ABT1LPJ5_9MICC|nr:excalibur calcium-binding domain-containing protein [Pseudarthrobacter humi]MCP9000383.1 excalibur calcium-binding domain-containing protein [Pseudarthrobacter humi]
MKKTLTLIVLTGLILTGCSGKQASAISSADAVAVETVAVPDVLSLTLDKATDQLEDLGFKVEAVDTVDGKSIIIEKNWEVTSQDPSEGAQAAKGSTVHLGVKNLEKAAAEKAAADKAAADKVAAEAAAAAKVVADKAAAEKAAADLAAAQAVKPVPVVPAPAPAPAPAPVVQAPAAVYYANCTAARAAGAAPIYAGTPGYGTHLDRDRDGIGCDK